MYQDIAITVFYSWMMDDLILLLSVNSIITSYMPQKCYLSFVEKMLCCVLCKWSHF